MSERAALYARVSTDIQRDNYSVPSQLKDMVNYGHNRKYTLVGDQFVDPETGKDVPQSNISLPAYVDDFTSRELSRPSLDAALRYLETFGFEVLIVHAIDRLARDPYFRQTIEREFMSRGARVEYVLGNYDETPEGEVRKDLDATFAKWENAKRVERTNRGKKRKAESGKFVAGTAPYGYRIDIDAFGGLSVYEPEAEIVKWIFSLVVEKRFSLNQVVKELQTHGIKSYEKKSVWAKSSIHRMLENTVYIGYFFFNKHKRQGKRLILRDQSEWMKINCNPIINEDVFLRAQEILAHNREYMRKLPQRFYLLSGMVICAECKKSYNPQTAKAGKQRRKNDTTTYRHRMGLGDCLNRSISGRMLESLVWKGVTHILLHPESIREGYEQMMQQQKEKQGRQIKHLETIQAAIAKFQARQNKLQNMYLDPDLEMTKEEYLEQKHSISSQLKELNYEAQKITQDLQITPNPADLSDLEQFAKKITEGLGSDLNISDSDKREIMQMLNLKVLISKGGTIKLKGWFIPEIDDLSSTTSIHYVHLRRRLQVHV